MKDQAILDARDAIVDAQKALSSALADVEGVLASFNSIDDQDLRGKAMTVGWAIEALVVSLPRHLDILRLTDAQVHLLTCK